MNFEMTQEQQLLVDSVERFITDRYALESRQEHSAQKRGFADENWQTMAELGWLALPFAEADGGFGGNQTDVMLLMEQFGKGLVVEPYLASVVLGGGVLKRAGSHAQRAALLPGVIDGSRQLALAYAEQQARYDLHDVVTTAKQEGDTFILNGHKSMVQNGGSATDLIVTARTSGGQIDRDGITLFALPADSDGVSVTSFPTVDGLAAAEIAFENVTVASADVVGEIGAGFAALAAAAIDGTLAVCAEAVGAMEVLYKDTVAYTQEREQFDHPLAEFQALQHRMVEMFMEYEQCKSLLYRATMETAAGSPSAEKTVHALKHLVGKTGSFIGENAVQLHGGMGMTEELAIGHYFKRLVVIDLQFGDADYHLTQFAA